MFRFLNGLTKREEQVGYVYWSYSFALYCVFGVLSTASNHHYVLAAVNALLVVVWSLLIKWRIKVYNRLRAEESDVERIARELAQIKRS